MTVCLVLPLWRFWGNLAGLGHLARSWTITTRIPSPSDLAYWHAVTSKIVAPRPILHTLHSDHEPAFVDSSFAAETRSTPISTRPFNQICLANRAENCALVRGTRFRARRGACRFFYSVPQPGNNRITYRSVAFAGSQLSGGRAARRVQRLGPRTQKWRRIECPAAPVHPRTARTRTRWPVLSRLREAQDFV